jgi:hypothetical protein
VTRRVVQAVIGALFAGGLAVGLIGGVNGNDGWIIVSFLLIGVGAIVTGIVGTLLRRRLSTTSSDSLDARLARSGEGMAILGLFGIAAALVLFALDVMD